MSHTPTPWVLDKTNALGAYGIWTDYATHPGHDGAGYGTQICSLITVSMPATSHKDERNANGEFIVRACNAHDDLVAACQALRDYLGPNIPTVDGVALYQQAEAAIAKATGTP